MRGFLILIPAKLSLFLFIAAFTLLLPKSHASHIMAGDLTYRFLGGLTYEITLKLYRDCNGVDLTNTATLQMRSSCDQDTQVVLNLLSGSGNILPLLCPSQQTNGSCLGGNLLGVKEYIYQNTIVLPNSCFDWQFSWTSCCRNGTISNLTNPYTRSFYLEAYLNHDLTGGNNSPSFGSIPTTYVCQGQPFAYTQGSSEVDGDSLVYSLVSPQTSATGTIPHTAGFSATRPVSPSLTINSQTGQLFFTPNAQQVAIVSILVEEYRNDSLIGSTRRDLQVTVLNCSNTLPFLSPAVAINVLVPAVQSSPLVLEICPDNNLSFVLQGLDLDLGDSVYIEPAGILPNGVNLMPSPAQGSGTLLVDWIPTAADIGTHVLEFLVRDNHCPLLGVQRYAVTVTVLDRTRAGPDLYYCPAGGPVRMGAIGGSSFVWTDFNMSPPLPGELSCDSCPNPMASPTITSTYIVTSNLGNCVNMDTVTVHVVADINLTTSALQDTICRGDSVQLSTQSNPSTNITYDWNPKGSILNPATTTPLAFPQQNTTYILSASSTAGCKVKDTLSIHVIDMEVTALAPKDKVCRLDSTVALHALITSNVPYSSQWQDPLGAILGQTDSIVFAGYFSGNYRVTVVDSTQFCAVQDSIQIDVLDLVVLPGTNSICPGDSIALNATYLGPTGLFFPSQCGPTDSCCGPRYTYTLGDTCDSNVGSTSCQTSGLQSTSYRATFEASRIQYLFQEGELQASGFQGGTIESISFHLSWLLVQGGNVEIEDMVIKMGCTSEDSLTDFADGLTTVWGPAPFLPKLGYNTHELDLAYDWTGSDNLVIQICSVDSANPLGFALYETSANTYSFPPTVKADRINAQPPCELIPDTALIYERPTIRFRVCVEGLNPVYSWSPTAGLSNPNIANPKASPASNTTYMLNVSVADSCICQLEQPAVVNINGCILDQAIHDFQVKKEGNSAQLRWKIDPAFTSSTLSIEKKELGEFTSIAKGKGKVEETLYDQNLSAGEHLYRLHLQDDNGHTAFSQVKSVWVTKEDLQARIYPNPVKHGMPIFIQHGDDLEGISVYSLMGKLVYQNKQFRGSRFLIPKITAGIYFIQLGSKTFKLTILD